MFKFLGVKSGRVSRAGLQSFKGLVGVWEESDQQVFYYLYYYNHGQLRPSCSELNRSALRPTMAAIDTQYYFFYIIPLNMV